MDQLEQHKNNKLKEEMAENWRSMTEKMEQRMVELMEKMAQKNQENIQLKGQNAKLAKENCAVKKKMIRIESYLPEAKKLLISRALPVELTNELFLALPLESAFGILSKMPNWLLAKNVRKILKNIEMAIKSNKWNAEDCEPYLIFSEDGLVVEHSGPNRFNTIRTKLPIQMKNLILPIAYFELEILKKNGNAFIGFCTQQFPSGYGIIGYEKNSIGFFYDCGLLVVDCLFASENANSTNSFEIGDVIGLGIYLNSANSPKCFVTFNGALLGITELPVNFATLQLFPAVMISAGNSIRANFGKEEWAFNTKQLVGQ